MKQKKNCAYNRLTEENFFSAQDCEKAFVQVFTSIEVLKALVGLNITVGYTSALRIRPDLSVWSAWRQIAAAHL